MSLWDPNVIPTELDADGINPRVGRDKADPIPVDPATGVLAAEWGVVKSAIPWMHTKIGTEDAPAFDSLRGIHGGDTVVMGSEWLEGTTASMHRWAAAGVGVAPTPLTTPRGGLSFPLDDVGGSDMSTVGYRFARAQTPYVRARYKLTGLPAVSFLVRFEDGAANEGWGIRFLTAGLKIQGVTRTGGADTPVDTGALWVVGTEVVVEFWVTANVLWVSVNGATAVNCGPAPAGDMRLRFWADAAGEAGDECEVRNPLIMANWA